MSPARLDALTDGVVAIVLTIMVLENRTDSCSDGDRFPPQFQRR